MEKRFRGVLFTVIAAVALLTAVEIIRVYQGTVSEQEERALPAYSEMLDRSGAVERMMEEQYTEDAPEILITVIDEEGRILYANDPARTGSVEIENCPDIAEALLWDWKAESIESEEGRTIHWCSGRRADGTVLRIGYDTYDGSGMLLKMGAAVLPRLLLVILIACMVSMVLAAWVIKPVRVLAEDPEGVRPEDIYPEIAPYVQTIAAQQEDIKRNAHMKEVFTSNVTHELKTPLASILGYAQILSRGNLSAEQQMHFAEAIEQNGKHLSEMINHVLCMSELDVKEQTMLNKERFIFYDLVSECVREMKEYADSRGIRLELAGEPAEIEADPAMAQLLVTNLISNAIRYNNPGGCVWVTADDKLVVEDNGIGIKKEDQAHIYERFYRVDKAESRRMGGSGLGLSIVKSIVDLHQGQITLESKEGAGTKFTVVL